MAVFAASDWGRRPRRVTAFYGLIGLASLSKGAAGLLPLAIAIVFTIANDGARAAKRLVSMPGWIIFVLMLSRGGLRRIGGGGKRFVDAVVVRDQLAWYFGSRGWGWQAMAARFSHPLAVMLPWCVALPMAIRAARRPVDSAQTAPLRFLFVWLATVFAIIAISNQQRERYYLPLCPARRSWSGGGTPRFRSGGARGCSPPCGAPSSWSRPRPDPRHTAVQRHD